LQYRGARDRWVHHLRGTAGSDFDRATAITDKVRDPDASKLVIRLKLCAGGLHAGVRRSIGYFEFPIQPLNDVRVAFIGPDVGAVQNVVVPVIEPGGEETAGATNSRPNREGDHATNPSGDVRGVHL
jgi:hypothetical protein